MKNEDDKLMQCAIDIREEQVRRVIKMLLEHKSEKKALYHSGLSEYDFNEALHEGIMQGRIICEL